MIAKNENLLAKISKMMKLSFGTALVLCVMLVFGAQEASAQNLVQGQAAHARLHPKCLALKQNNCIAAAPQGTPSAVVASANQLRCEFYTGVLGAFSQTLGTLQSNPVSTISAINTTYDSIIARHPGATAKAAADLLKNEITDFLKS